MEHQPDLKQVERNFCHHIEQDGLMDVYGGVVLIATSICLGSSLLVGVLIFLAALVCPKILERTRCKYTYPRLGYAKLFNPHRRITPFLGAIFIIFYAGVLVGVFSMEPKIKEFLNYETIFFPALSGIALAAGCIHAYYKLGSHRYLAYLPICLGLGAYFSLFNSSPLDNRISSMLFIVGILLLLTGLFVFIRFVREHRPQPEETARGQ